MNTITTIIDERIGLTTITVKGVVQSEDLLAWINKYYRGIVTLKNLWDFTGADLTQVNANGLIEIAEEISAKRNCRTGGKSAFVFSQAAGYGMGRMYGSFAELEDVEWETGCFMNMHEAHAWLNE